MEDQASESRTTEERKKEDGDSKKQDTHGDTATQGVEGVESFWI